MKIMLIAMSAALLACDSNKPQDDSILIGDSRQKN
jgi:hypothetical protein